VVPSLHATCKIVVRKLHYLPYEKRYYWCNPNIQWMCNEQYSNKKQHMQTKSKQHNMIIRMQKSVVWLCTYSN
jgi:hypothetical protein